MPVDTRLPDSRRIMGERLKEYREGAGVSVAELAERTEVDRTSIYGIEAGKFNFTIDMYVNLLGGCGVSFEEFLAGFQSSDIKPDHRQFHRMLSIILDSGIAEQIQGVRTNLEAVAEKVVRLMKSRASPSLNPAGLGRSQGKAKT